MNHGVKKKTSKKLSKTNSKLKLFNDLRKFFITKRVVFLEKCQLSQDYGGKFEAMSPQKFLMSI